MADKPLFEGDAEALVEYVRGRPWNRLLCWDCGEISASTIPFGVPGYPLCPACFVRRVKASPAVRQDPGLAQALAGPVDVKTLAYRFASALSKCN